MSAKPPEQVASEIIQQIVRRATDEMVHEIWSLTQQRAPVDNIPFGKEHYHSYLIGYFDGVRAAINVAEKLQSANAGESQPTKEP